MYPVIVGLQLAWRWVVFYTVLCFVTQLWAGSQFSEGQGGGFGELVMWAAIGGALAVAVAVERAMHGSRDLRPRALFIAAVVGQTIGAVIAIFWFTSKGGPAPGDWWIGPISAAFCVGVWCWVFAPRVRGDSAEEYQQ